MKKKPLVIIGISLIALTGLNAQTAQASTSATDLSVAIPPPISQGSESGCSYAAIAYGMRGFYTRKTDIPAELGTRTPKTTREVYSSTKKDGLGALLPPVWIKRGNDQKAFARIKASIEGALATGHPVASVIQIGPWFLQQGGSNSAPNRTSGAFHQILLIGADENGVLVQNSWGASWGAGGRASMPWSVLEESIIEASYSRNCLSR